MCKFHCFVGVHIKGVFREGLRIQFACFGRLFYSVSLLEMIEVKPTRAKVLFVDHLIHRSPRGTMIHSYCLLSILNKNGFSVLFPASHQGEDELETTMESGIAGWVLFYFSSFNPQVSKHLWENANTD